MLRLRARTQILCQGEPIARQKMKPTHPLRISTGSILFFFYFNHSLVYFQTHFITHTHDQNCNHDVSHDVKRPPQKHNVLVQYSKSYFGQIYVLLHGMGWQSVWRKSSESILTRQQEPEMNDFFSFTNEGRKISEIRDYRVVDGNSLGMSSSFISVPYENETNVWISLSKLLVLLIFIRMFSREDFFQWKHFEGSSIFLELSFTLVITEERRSHNVSFDWTICRNIRRANDININRISSLSTHILYFGFFLVVLFIAWNFAYSLEVLLFIFSVNGNPIHAYDD